MEIGIGSKDFKEQELILTAFENSTSSVNGTLTGVSFHEEDLSTLMRCLGNIVKIDCNFVHLIAPGYIPREPVKKSNRGRKKKERVRKNRKYQGDGSSFNSQITFTVLGTVVRLHKDDKHKHSAVPLPDGMERITKEYKIKVFRNGSIAAPGVLREDLQDVIPPLREVADYLDIYLNSGIKVENIHSVMRNYKCFLIKGKIDMRALQDHCISSLNGLINTRFSDIIDFLTNPILERRAHQPQVEGWNSSLARDTCQDYVAIDFGELVDYLQNSSSIKNLFVSPDNLRNKLAQFPLGEIYNKLQKLYYTLNENYLTIPDAYYRRVCEYLLANYMPGLNKSLTKSKDNHMAFFKYNPEKYPGFIIKIKTPIASRPDKQTTIKLFPSGKINIDGANSREEAEYIYYWVNDMLCSRKGLVRYDEYIDYDASDSEFSSDDEFP